MIDNKNISIIAAVSENNVIGKNGGMPWHLPDDLKNFKKITSGKTIIMGRRTWDSLPIKPLPNRKHIVLSSMFRDIPGVVTAKRIEDIVNNMSETEQNFFIGGKMLYDLFIIKADNLYLTRVHNEFEGDTFFTHYLQMEQWELVNKEYHDVDEKHKYPFTFYEYKRIQYT